MQYKSVAEARNLTGLRVVLTQVPGPWTEAIKGLLHVKRLDFTPVAQEMTGPNQALMEWTAQTSAPVAIYNDERPRSTWVEQLYLVERLAPQPQLIPTDPGQRVLMFGLSNEICSETGVGWSMRLVSFHRVLSNPATNEKVRRGTEELGRKYGYSPAAGEAAIAKVIEVLRLLGAQLEKQRAGGSSYFIGSSLTALDIYWATFAEMIEPLPHELCPMPKWLRANYSGGPEIMAAATPLLLEHRDFIYHRHLKLPVEF